MFIKSLNRQFQVVWSTGVGAPSDSIFCASKSFSMGSALYTRSVYIINVVLDALHVDTLECMLKAVRDGVWKALL